MKDCATLRDALDTPDPAAVLRGHVRLVLAVETDDITPDERAAVLLILRTLDSADFVMREFVRGDYASLSGVLLSVMDTRARGLARIGGQELAQDVSE